MSGAAVCPPATDSLARLIGDSAVADDLRAKLAYELTEWKHRLASRRHCGLYGAPVTIARLVQTLELLPPLMVERGRGGTTVLTMKPPPDADGVQFLGDTFFLRLGTRATRSMHERLIVVIDSWIRWVDGPYFTLAAATSGDAPNREKRKRGRRSISPEDRKESERVVYLWKLANCLGMREREFTDLHQLSPGLESHAKRLRRELVCELSKSASKKAEAFLSALDRDDLSVREVAAWDKFDDVLEAGVEAEHVERVVNSSRKK